MDFSGQIAIMYSYRYTIAMGNQKIVEKQTSSGEKIAYYLEGDEKNAPIVLISGFTGTHGDLLELARQLKDKYFIIIPEFPGWGDSPEGHSHLTIVSYANVIRKVLDDLSLRKATLVAHCMGATVALEAAYRFPERIKGLILISTPYQDGTAGQVFFRFMTKLSEKTPERIRPLFFFWRSRIITIPISFFVLQTRTLGKKLKLVEKTLTQQAHQDEHVLEMNWNSLVHYDYQKLKKLSVPVHLLHGEKDLLVPITQAEKLSHILPHTTLDVLSHAGHLPPIETPETVAHTIEKYLA